MGMSATDRKRKQRANPLGYAKSREVDWKQHGIKNATYVRYLELIVEQNGQCAICHIDINTSSPLDHDHVTGEIRAVLCTPCNLIVGQIENARIQAVQAVIAYLKENGSF